MFNTMAVGAFLLAANLGSIPTQLAELEQPKVEIQAEEKHSSSRQSGLASYYSNYYNGRRMANGQLFYNSSNSCAHRTLRFGTTVTIRNPANGKTATCVVRDRGPFVSGRVIDLSTATFSQLAPLSQGVVRVELNW